MQGIAYLRLELRVPPSRGHLVLQDDEPLQAHAMQPGGIVELELFVKPVDTEGLVRAQRRLRRCVTFHAWQEKDRQARQRAMVNSSVLCQVGLCTRNGVAAEDSSLSSAEENTNWNDRHGGAGAGAGAGAGSRHGV